MISTPLVLSAWMLIAFVHFYCQLTSLLNDKKAMKKLADDPACNLLGGDFVLLLLIAVGLIMSILFWPIWVIRWILSKLGFKNVL